MIGFHSQKHCKTFHKFEDVFIIYIVIILGATKQVNFILF